MILTVHGILHLLGYDHMNEKDEKIIILQEKEQLLYVIPIQEQN